MAAPLYVDSGSHDHYHWAVTFALDNLLTLRPGAAAEEEVILGFHKCHKASAG